VVSATPVVGSVRGLLPLGAAEPFAGPRMTDVLLILDGATDPEPSTLDEAHTPALDRVVAEGYTEWLDLLDPGPLAQALRAVGGQLRVCADHGCDPATGEHLAGPVPCVSWSAALVAT
jgi:hypothetical protein